MIATQRLYRTEDDRIVPEGDPDARWLFASAGTEISAADAAKYGLDAAAEPAAAEPASADEEAPAEPDAAEGPAVESADEELPKPKRRKKSSN